MDDIDRAKSTYSHYSLHRLKALAETKATYAQSATYDHCAILELISEKEQALAAEVANGAGRRAWVAIGISALALAFSVWSLAHKSQDLPPPPALPQAQPNHSPDLPAVKSPASPASPARDTSTTLPTPKEQ